MSICGNRPLLCVDVGNTHVVLGLFEGGAWVRQWRVKTNPRATADEYAVYLETLLQGVLAGGLEAVAISSVVPPVTATLVRWARDYLQVKAAVLGADDVGRERVRYDDPRQLGTDRLANAMAAHALTGGAAIVVDCGTATKFEFVDERGVYWGGAIAPGLGIASDALFARAARLYRVPLVAPQQILGRNTVHALQVGLLYGHAALVDGMVHRIRRETGVQAPAIATGGFAPLVVPLCRAVDRIVDTLTLDGIRLIFAERKEKNTRSAAS
ncbi:MAG: type III pantothenate kinase [Candidatus Binatia bacterium]|nr:type III pantothenate kinase [Candidatus Binatia bacterium]